MVKEYNLNNKNFRLFILDKYFQQEFRQETKHNLEGIHISFSLKGTGKYESLVKKHIVNAEESSSGMDLVSIGNEGILSVPADTHRKSLSLFIDKNYILNALTLNKKTEDIYNFFDKKCTIQNLKNKKINPNSTIIVNNIINNPYIDDLSKLSLEARVLDLLYFELSELFNQEEKNDKKIIFSKEDKDAIYYAKEILTTTLENPPSIENLAKIVRINEFKLKYGFEKFFNNTPYNLSLEARLNEAKKLLETSELNINEIALKVGYKYSQSFSNAFYKKFGIRPKELMKSRKYYY